ncbi:hypothetical protein [Sutcliffiella horikoshii]|uniref:hypothetical protein n=1 Tax=Sutcliffiella horikoshii TaxID=79883 RepID=UPI001CFDF27B|nr:hypothetical protein [Sutcliffiella horikoshii]
MANADLNIILISSLQEKGAIQEQGSAPVFILTKEIIILKEFLDYEIIGIKQSGSFNEDEVELNKIYERYYE